MVALLGREVPRQGVALTIKDNTVSADLYIVVASGINIVEIGYCHSGGGSVSYRRDGGNAGT